MIEDTGLCYFDMLPLHSQPERLESFTSYIIRFAQSNGLKRMRDFAYVFFPETLHRHRNLAKYFTDYTPPSFGALAKVGGCCEAVLQETTFFHLATKFNHSPWYDPLNYFLREAISPYLRYCPECLIESRSPYYSLIWRFLLIPKCHRHNCPLLDRCGHCGQKMPIFSLPPKIATCPTCGGDLRKCLSPSNFSEEPPNTSMDAEDLAFLLTPNIYEEVKTSVSSVGALLVSMRQSMNLSARQLARALQIKHDEVESIELNTSGTTLLNYVKYTNYMGVSLRYLFNTAYTEGITHRQSPEEKYVRLVEDAIPRLEHLSEPIQLKTVSQLTGIPAQTLGHYPRVKILLAQYNEMYYAEKTRQFMLREEELVNKVQEARDQLLSLGKAISQRNICRIVGMWGTSLKKYPRVKEVLDQYVREYYFYRNEAKKQRENGLIEKVQKAIQQLEDLQRPVTTKSVSQIVGISPVTLRSHISVRKLIGHYVPKNLKIQEQERILIEEKLVEKVQVTIQDLKSSNAYISLQKLCELIGVPANKLRFYTRAYNILKPYINDEIEMCRAERGEFLLGQVREIISMVKPFSKSTLDKVIKEHMGLTYRTVKEYPQVRAFIDQYAQDCQQQQACLKEDALLNRLQEAFASLQYGKSITMGLLAAESGIKVDQIKYYPRLLAFAKQCIEESISSQKQIGQQDDDELLEQMQKAIQTLKSLNKSISQAKIIKILHISKKRLHAYPQAKEILEQDRKNDRLQEEINILERMKETIISLHDSGSPITQRAISSSIGIGRTQLHAYPKVREIMVRVKERGQELKEKQSSQIKAHSQQDTGGDHRLHRGQVHILEQELLAMVEEAIEQLRG